MFHNWELAMAISNTKIMLIINYKMSILTDSLGHLSILGALTLALDTWPDNHDVLQILIASSILAFMLI